MSVPQLSAADLAERLGGDDVYLLDVREPWELDIARLDAAVNIPMDQVPDAIDRLRAEAADKTLVVMCRSGGRSMTIAKFLNHSGFSDVFNLDGGILAWSDQVDASVPRY